MDGWYQQSMRTVKYAFMFIALTFILFFFVEVFNKKNIHPIQYLLVGLVLVMFFTLLISISEHLGFDWAYLISATAVVVLITVYVKAVLDSGKLSLITAGVLVILYGFIYITLQLEDYALLMGSIGLFVILAIIMIFSRKINWYEVAQNNQA
jgi:inner membrane protein